ncbi:unannotated protein [freshwater metagenome]|uniref:Unannotated protein n=1 Tax=freshwater metagenome TaxID=449393 RepID=A0A6J7HXD8_9ZZZZ|nr:amidohydrolase family protein [Actinomycetota bacterium]
MTTASSAGLVRAPAPAASLLIRSARVLDPRGGPDGTFDVLVRDGVIAELGAPSSLPLVDGVELIEAEGRLLAPAFTDPHIHLRTPGQEYKEDLETGTRSAAAGGYCQVIGMPNTDPVVDSAPILRSLYETAARDARIPVGFVGSITVGLQGRELTEMEALRDAGALGFSDDGRPVAHAGILRRALQYQQLTGAVLALHEEDFDLSARGSMHEGAVSARLGIAGIPSISESAIIARDILIAGHEGGAIHLQHLSSAESVLAVERGKADGVRVTCEASPHHLCLTDEAVVGFDTSMKMNPPLRTERDRQALIEGLRSGVIDCVATDHAPHARDEKEKPFEQAPMGTTGLETAFAAIHTELVLPGILALDLLLERMTSGCAIFGLPIPRIAVGETANLALIDLDAEWLVGENGYESRSANCCFAGRRLRGRVVLTLADGAVAFRERGFTLSAAPDPAGDVA